jgi:hypothetical protein
MATAPRPTDSLELRIGELLERLDLHKSYGDEKRLATWVLADKTTTSPHSVLATAGYAWANGATQAQINSRVCLEILGRSKKLDRETFRDYVLLPLREVGVIEELRIYSAEERRADPTLPLTKRGEWKSKSASSSYILTEEAERLLVETSDDEWEERLDEFLEANARRRERATQHTSSAAVASADVKAKHTVLIAAAAKAHEQSPLLKGFDLLFIDDGDGDRIKEPYLSRLKSSGLELNLDTRYPDVIFGHLEKRKLWIIDAVTSDGEVDSVRLNEMSAWAGDAGWELAGATTAYETLAAYSGRQKKMTNIASGTYIWIAEIGGQLLHLESLA